MHSSPARLHLIPPSNAHSPPHRPNIRPRIPNQPPSLTHINPLSVSSFLLAQRSLSLSLPLPSLPPLTPCQSLTHPPHPISNDASGLWMAELLHAPEASHAVTKRDFRHQAQRFACPSWAPRQPPTPSPTPPHPQESRTNLCCTRSSPLLSLAASLSSCRCNFFILLLLPASTFYRFLHSFVLRFAPAAATEFHLYL